MYSFDDFIFDVKWRVRHLARGVSDPAFLWPGLLLLDVCDGLSIEAFEIGQTVEARETLVVELVSRIRAARPRRFCWAMPCERQVADSHQECLLLVFGQRDRAVAALAEVVRDSGRAPRLGAFNDGPFGRGARRISGRFVEPLLEALR